MQMLCKVSAGFSDVRCPVCGQGFQVYWTRQRELSRAEQRDALQRSLREQHLSTETSDAHPATFQLPDVPAAAMPGSLATGLSLTAVPLYS